MNYTYCFSQSRRIACSKSSLEVFTTLSAIAIGAVRRERAQIARGTRVRGEREQIKGEEQRRQEKETKLRIRSEEGAIDDEEWEKQSRARRVGDAVKVQLTMTCHKTRNANGLFE